MRPEVEAFVKFYLEKAPTLVKQVGYVPFKKTVYEAALRRFNERMIGTVFGKETQKTAKLEERLKLKGF
jgi:phosphate transport system substrate-binding protein